MNIDPLPHPEDIPNFLNHDTLARCCVALLPGEEWHCIKLTENSITMECSTLTVTISTTAEP